MNNWIALYNDETKLEQFEGEKENLFGDIDQDKLIAFIVNDTVTNNHILVDLTLGLFGINGNVFEVPNMSNRSEKYRLIYFRRNQQNMGTAPGMRSDSVSHFIGFQVTIDGKNNKVIFSEKDNKYQIRIN